jgi:hypothetical protein
MPDQQHALQPVDYNPFVEASGDAIPDMSGFGTSWLDRATQQTKKDTETFQQSGMPGIARSMVHGDDTSQELASGFGGNIRGVGVGAAAAKVAPPFYSAVENAIAEIPQTKAVGQQWAATLRNRPGVKPEEIEQLGLDDWLKSQRGAVTKDQIADYVRTNKVQVNDVMKNSQPPAGTSAILPSGISGFLRTGSTEWIPETKFGHDPLVLPGGENYKELLLTLPQKEVTKPGPFGQPTKYLAPGEQTFRSTHYDEPNILAHVRFNDRTIDGKKTLFVEEVQSDWHQQGRKQGYQVKPPDVKVEQVPGTDRYRVIGQNQGSDPIELVSDAGLDDANRYADNIRRISVAKGVPDAPFKTTWPDLAMKRIIHHAAENGYDKVAWTPGDVQGDRYNYRRQVDAISYDPVNKRLSAWMQPADVDENWRQVVDKEFNPEDLEKHIGKDLAKKLLEADKVGLNSVAQRRPFKIGEHVLEGDDLKLGGEGMRGFYDRMLPAKVNNIVKKYGAQVEQSRLAIPHKGGVQGQVLQVPSIDITPSLRSAALQKGFPLFAAPAAAALLNHQDDE